MKNNFQQLGIKLKVTFSKDKRANSMITREINSNWKRLSWKKIYFNKVFFQQCGIIPYIFLFLNDEKMKWAIICSRMFYCILCNLTRKFFVSHSNMSQFIILKFQNIIYISFLCFLINQIEKENKNDVEYVNRFLCIPKNGQRQDIHLLYWIS